MWRDCMGQALQNYEESHNLHALQAATGSCQVRLEEQGGEDFAGTAPRWRRPPRMAVAISAAAGGPSAAMPTATVRRGVVASDDRKWDAAQLQAPRPRLATTAQRRLRSSAAKDTAMV
jgi:hypothetical protein